MEKKRTGQIVTILVLSFAVLFMSVGFAAFSQTLDINGTANVDAAKWSVHFDKATYEETTGSVTATNPTIGDTSITYEITLEKPGDYYSFNINVINDGTFDANLTKDKIEYNPKNINQPNSTPNHIMFLSSSMAEHSAVNRRVVGSSPTWRAKRDRILNLVSFLI